MQECQVQEKVREGFQPPVSVALLCPPTPNQEFGILL